ncbi:MAG: glycosyltransferase [Verrucomicrobiales bacterium]|nr:glycosyltransferase [Verrucomicrobiales bacterium]
MSALHFLPVSELSPSRLIARTRRSLERAGLLDVDGLVVAKPGAWLLRPQAAAMPGTGDFIAVGLGQDRERARLLQSCGGDFSCLRWWQRGLRQLPAVSYLSGQSADAFRCGIARGQDPASTLERLLSQARHRVIHLPALDWQWDERLRIVQAVTTIQIGGAEKVALDLKEELSRMGFPTLLAALGKSTRESYPPPGQFVDLSDSEHRGASLRDAAADFGADVIHAHLLSAGDIRFLTGSGWPVAVTLHNTANAWPGGMAELKPGDASLLLGCSLAVERQIHQMLPHRTLWNGVPTHHLPAARSGFWRRHCGISLDAAVLLALANVRPQKRFDRFPAILDAVRKALPSREVHLFLAGSGTESLTLPPGVHALGLVADTTPLLADCDALVSASDHEGLSLAQLEALAAGKPVIATDVGGAREVDGIHLVPPGATPEQFAQAIGDALAKPPPSLPRHFTRHAMAARAAALYPRLCLPPRKIPQRGLWLVCNNFSTGGAQSSARRLLLELHRQGIPVRAAVVEEHPGHPTPGRKALQQAGIRVVSLPPPSEMDAESAVSMLLEHIDSSAPAAIVFWNLITSYKMLIADLVLDIPIFDVSPGEMYFQSLLRYFESPRTGLPCLEPSDYGRRLSAVVVKYADEAATAARLLGCSVQVIPNGISVPETGRVHAATTPLVIATAARLSPDKKLEDLLDAFRLALPNLPRCEIQIAGGPDGGNLAWVRELKRRAAGLPVRWLGSLADVSAFLRRTDIFAMISEPAGCPNASLEAMAHGLPVVATHHGGMAEQVADGVTGYLVPRGVPKAFAEKLVLLAHDWRLRQRLGLAGRERIRERFSLQRMVESYRKVLGLAP